MRASWCWLVAGALLGCGGSSEASSPAATETTETSGSESTGAATASIDWESMNDEQRGRYMAEVVMPEMRTLFTEFDGEEFANFSCATCHGENAHDVGFHMPNGLHPLDPSTIPAMFGSSDPMQVFMTQRVWPRMAELLHEPQYNPETHQGFSCMNCHAMAEGASH